MSQISPDPSVPAETDEDALIESDLLVEDVSIAIAGVMTREPGITREAARRRVLRQILGDALFEAAYGSRGES